MSVIATGVNKLLTFKKQAGLGSIATTGSGQNLRRVTSTLDKKKATYASKEIRPSQQVSDFRHGVVAVDGVIAGEASVGTYQAFTESILRQLAQASVTTGALITVAAAATTPGFGTFTRSAGSYLTDGFKIGMVGRWTGWATTGTANNAANMIIVALTATVMTVARLDGLAIAPKVAGDSVTFATVGKHSYAPQSGHTRDYYTIEHNFADIVQSEVFTDCVVTQMDVKLPASGMSGVDFTIKGIDMVPGTTGYFVTPNAVTTGTALAAANGIVILNGVAVGLITGLNFSVKGGHTVIGGVVGSNLEPDIFPGTITTDGQATVLFQDATIRDYFINETEVSIIAVFSKIGRAHV